MGSTRFPAVACLAPDNRLNSIYEQAHQKQRTDNSWGCLHHSSGGSRDEEKVGGPSDTKPKGAELEITPSSC